MRAAELSPEGIRLDNASRWTAVAALVCAVGLIATVLLVLGSEQGGLERFYRSYLVSFMFVLSLALGGLFFVMISHLTRAGWSVALRRIGEVLAATLLPLALPGLVLLFGVHELYEWSHAGAVEHDLLLQQKQPFLNTTFFIVRFFVYFGVWSLLAWFFLRGSVRQDASGDPGLTLRMERAAAPGMILFALSVTLVSFDWIMSLYPHWYSTIFGVYYFAGCVLGMFSLVSLLVYVLQRSGRLREAVTVEHYHDLGKMMFAFVVFWAYIAFSQYMLIWYANIPEETIWYKVRQTGSWTWLSLVLLFGHFFVPFLWLLSRHIKRRRGVLALAAVWLLAMHWLDLYYLIMPEASPQGMQFDALDLSCLLMLGGYLLAALFWQLGRAPLVPLRDPRLAESLGLENV